MNIGAILNLHPQKFLPLADVAFEAHTVGNLESRNHASLDCLPLFPARFKLVGLDRQNGPKDLYVFGVTIGSTLDRRESVLDALSDKMRQYIGQ
jgi:hypothetical protein